ncbi:MAG TPA: sulfatase-like hydrolase/transferase [Polyangiales bacterium]|nr:sulfatase-like hydrolase/transferase [Polyangiales bacterium]
MPSGRAGTAPNPTDSLWSRLSTFVWSLLCAGLLLAAMEFGVVARRTELSPLSWLGYASLTVVVVCCMSVLTAAAAGAVSVLGAAALQRLRSERLKSWLSVGAWGLALGLVTVVVMRPWNLARDPFAFAYSVPTACVLAALLARPVRRRLGPEAFAALSVVCVIALYALNAQLYRGLYLSLHRAALWLSWGVLAFALAPFAQDAKRLWRAAPWLASLVAAFGHLALSETGRAREFAVLHGELTPTFVGALQDVTDRDRDGYSALLGGGDCNDDDPTIMPGRCEIPNNGVDDNCNGAVDSSAVMASRPPSAAVSRTPRADMPDVYFVVLDTLCGNYGGGPRSERLPSLERLAASSLDFPRTYAPYPATFKSLLAMIQSRSARRFMEGGDDFGMLLARAGFDAQMWVGEERLTIEPHANARWPMTVGNQPFFFKDKTRYYEWSRAIVDRALAELDTPSERPRYRWLHLLDLHDPWLHTSPLTEPHVRYATELKHLEPVLARLLDALAQHPRTRNAVVVVMGDHGEQLGEHGAHFHDAFLWEQSIHTALVMHLPGVSPRVIREPVSLIDVAPTLSNYLGLNPLATFEGHDWLAQPEHRAHPPVSEVGRNDVGGGIGTPARHAVIGERYKLIFNVTENVAVFYDLSRDLGELQSLQASQVPDAARLSTELVSFQDAPGCAAY